MNDKEMIKWQENEIKRIYELIDEQKAENARLLEITRTVIAENTRLAEQLKNAILSPCKVGDTVYAIAKCSDVKRSLDGSYYSSDGSPGTATGWYCAFDGKENMCPLCGEEECNEQDYAIFESVVEGLNYFAEHNRWELYLDNLDDFKSYHLTKPEAEARLKEQEEKDAKN